MRNDLTLAICCFSDDAAPVTEVLAFTGTHFQEQMANVRMLLFFLPLTSDL